MPKHRIQQIDHLVEEALELVGADEQIVEEWVGKCKCRSKSQKRMELETWARMFMGDKFGEGPDGITEGLKRLEQLVGKSVRQNAT